MSVQNSFQSLFRHVLSIRLLRSASRTSSYFASDLVSDDNKQILFFSSSYHSVLVGPLGLKNDKVEKVRMFYANKSFNLGKQQQLMESYSSKISVCDKMVSNF